MATATATKKKVRINGCVASAQAAKYADVDVITAYPIRPYTATMMALAQMVANGELDAEYIVADSDESAVVQAFMIGGIAVVLTSMLLLLWVLDNPYQSSVGGLKPTAMERTLVTMDQGARAIGFTPADLCDANGNAT